ncbi:MAG: excisionase [Proteobacteria bacterium SG_bin6]|nr:MAG: excisionase [Proteobacteria bacterium SG_bin6]
MEPITVTIKDAQKATGLGATKLYELIGQGRLKAVKVGRRTLVTTQSIRELVGQAAA